MRLTGCPVALQAVRHLARMGYGEGMRIALLLAALLLSAACTSDEEAYAVGYSDGCDHVSTTAYEFGMQNGAMCHPGEPGLMCAPVSDGAYGDGWMTGCDECFQGAYDAGWLAAAPEGCLP